MTPDAIASLNRAFQLLPHTTAPHCLGKLLCTLVYLKVWSDNYPAPRAMLQVQGLAPEVVAATLARRGLIVMDAQSMFAACRSGQPAATSAAICDAFLRLTQLNPDLSGVLSPLYFGALNGLYAHLAADPASLSQVITEVGHVTLEHSPPSLACGNEFGNVINLVCCQGNNADTVAPLIARLLQPQANEVALDLACGQGHLLFALASELAHTEPGAALQLIGREDDARHWALAKMRFSLAGLAHGQILNQAALHTCFSRLPSAAKVLAIGSADLVVMALPETATPWSHELAFQEQDPRFALRPPIDSRIALVWLALAAMKPQGGRMALLLALVLLDGYEGDALRKYLVNGNWLGAVIAFTDLPGMVLLLLRPSKVEAEIAFIHAQEHGAAGIDSALHIWSAWQRGKDHAGLISVSRDVLASQHYQLGWQVYVPS